MDISKLKKLIIAMLIVLVASIAIAVAMPFFIRNVINFASYRIYTLTLPFTMADVRYQQTHFSIFASMRYDSERRLEPYRGQYEFEDAEVAIADFIDVNIDPEDFQEIMRLEEGSYIFIFTPGYVFRPTQRPLEPHIPTVFLTLFIERENSMISPVYLWRHGIESFIDYLSGILHDEDRIARDIVLSHIQADITSRVNGGVPIFYGVGVGSPPEHIFILGLEPDEIIAFDFRDDQYFLWYYLSTPHFGDILAENIDISESFTLAETIELFDIRVYR